MTDRPGGGGPRTLLIRDVRSVWGVPVEIPLGQRVTVLVGPNRSGTTNVAWALTAALDPDHTFDPRRDVPRRRRDHADPGVRLDLADGSRITVSWDRRTGARTEDGARARAPVVWSPVDGTDRDLLRAARVDLADPQRRDRLGAAIQQVAAAVLPGIASAGVDVTGEVVVRDDLGSAIAAPELRAIVAIALCRDLAASGRAPAATVIEAPEVFLHPAGQQAIADLLGDTAEVAGTPVVVTTTSPFAIPRHPSTTVVALARDQLGRTQVSGTANGDAPQAPLLGGLLRDAGLAAVLDRVSSLPATTRGVLIVEGGTDEAYLRQAARTLDRLHVLDGIAIRPAGGAMAAAAAAIVLRAESELPVVVLLDHDGPGRRAIDTLVSRFGVPRSRGVLTYADVFAGGPLDVEAETLFDQGLLRRFVLERGPASSHGEVELPQGLTHVDLTSSGKSAFVGWSERAARPEHLERWGRLLDLIDDRFPPAP